MHSCAHVLAGRDERFSEAIDALLNHDIGDGERVELLLTQASVTMRLSGSDETAASLWLDAALLSPKDVVIRQMVQCFSESNAWATVISTLVEQAVVAQSSRRQLLRLPAKFFEGAGYSRRNG